MFQIKPYTLRLKRPLILAHGIILNERKGVLVYDPETGGWGDAAPLPGFSKESIEDVLQACREERWKDEALPSLRFAVESAVKPFRLPTAAVKVNALWIPSSESVSDFSTRISGWQNPMVKIKPGNEPQLQPIRDLLALRPDVRLRIDGNRQWSVEQTLKLYDSLPVDSVDYIEEPLADPEAYTDLWSRDQVPVALDESLFLPEGQILLQHPAVKALVIKPTLMGDSINRAPWISQAEERQLDITWSSCFESGVGLWHLATLANASGPAGLDTGAVFESDVVEPRPLIENGQIQITYRNVKVTVRTLFGA